jgi:hypothetical protein
MSKKIFIECEAACQNQDDGELSVSQKDECAVVSGFCDIVPEVSAEGSITICPNPSHQPIKVTPNGCVKFGSEKLCGTLEFTASAVQVCAKAAGNLANQDGAGSTCVPI